MHHIRTPLSKLHSLYSSCLENHSTNSRLIDIARHKLFKPIGIKKAEIDKLSFVNKRIDIINLGNIFHHKSVKYQIPAYFKDNYIPIISYTYITPMATKLFNYKMALQDFNIDDFKPKPPDSTCARSSFIYIPAGHIITDDHIIINNTSLRYVFAEGLKYREPKSISWKHNFWIPSRIMTDNGQNVKRRAFPNGSLIEL
jgi:hypothetical protein